MMEQLITSKFHMKSSYHRLPSTFCHHIYSFQNFKTPDTKPITQNMTTLNISSIINYQAKANTDVKISRYGLAKIKLSPWGPAMDTRPSSLDLPPMILSGVTLPAHATKYLNTSMTNLHITKLLNSTKIRGSCMATQGRYIQYHSSTRNLTIKNNTNTFWLQHTTVQVTPWTSGSGNGSLQISKVIHYP